MHNLLYLAGKNEFEVEQIMEEHPRWVLADRHPFIFHHNVYSVYRQPNEQARVVAPVVDGATLKEISFTSEARNLIIVRHPFERYVVGSCQAQVWVIPVYANFQTNFCIPWQTGEVSKLDMQPKTELVSLP